VAGGNPENLAKSSGSKVKSQKQTQPTYMHDAGSEI